MQKASPERTALHKMVVKSIQGCVPPKEIKERIRKFDCSYSLKYEMLRKMYMEETK